MDLKNTGKTLKRLIISLFAALITLYPSIYFFSEPRLGPHYDMLMRLRPDLKPARLLDRFIPSRRQENSAADDNNVYHGILLIETGDGGSGENVIASSTVFDMLMTLAEMDAGSLLIETPVLGVSGGHSPLSEAELVYRFDEEFNLIESNIQNLFDGIKFGSISPIDAARYVNDVIKLTEQGKNRLLSAAVEGGEEQAEQLENAISVFGSVYIPGDLLVDVIRSDNDAPPALNRSHFPVYFRPPPDKDGKIRRIAPILSAAQNAEYEYAAYSALKNKFAHAEVRAADDGFVLALTEKTPVSGAPQEAIFVLDGTASLLFDIPQGGAASFRKINLALFLEYTETEKMLYRLLAEASTLAQYADISVENYPPFLYAEALLLRETLLENPGAELLERWKSLRSSYYDSLDRFFDEDNGAGNKIISSFRELGEQENLDDDGRERLDSLRDEQLEMFNTARDLYTDISALRRNLETELSGSFCILGPASLNTGLSAMFANSIITGKYIIPANIKQILFSSLAVVLFSLFVMCGMGATASFCFCILITAFTLAGFSYSFVVSGLWIDPVIPGSALAVGALFSSLYALYTKKETETRLRCAYAGLVSEAHLKKMLCNPRLAADMTSEKKTTAKAAVVTVSRPILAAAENGGDAQKSASALRQFRDDVCSVFTRAGAVICGCDGDTVSAAFGSPLELKKKTAGKNPVLRAVEAVNLLFETLNADGTLYAGIDYGECVFFYAPPTRYTASGSPVFRSRLLVTLAYRGKTSALISKTAGEQVDSALLRGVTPAGASGDGAETSINELYYQLLPPR
jgi:hypothetical protein